MELEVILFTKAFATIVALEFCFFQVCLTIMLGQVALLRELFITMVAAIWLFSGVRAHMFKVFAHGEVGETADLTIWMSFVAALE